MWCVVCDCHQFLPGPSPYLPPPRKSPILPPPIPFKLYWTLLSWSSGWLLCCCQCVWKTATSKCIVWATKNHFWLWKFVLPLLSPMYTCPVLDRFQISPHPSSCRLYLWPRIITAVGKRCVNTPQVNPFVCSTHTISHSPVLRARKATKLIFNYFSNYPNKLLYLECFYV